MLLHGVAEEVGYGEEAAGFFAHFPDVAVGVQRGDHFAELRCGVGAEAGDDAVVKQDEGNHGKNVRPEETGKAERANEGRGEEATEKHQSHLRDSDRMAASAFENSYSLAMVHRVLQNADSLRLWKMMEGTENRAEPGESCGDFRGINRFRPVGYRAMRFFFYALECGGVRVQIREANFREATVSVTQRFMQPGPGAAAAGTQVHYAGSFADPESVLQSGGDVAVETAEA